MTRVIIPSHLRGYSQGQQEIHVEGETLDAVIWGVEARFPGVRARIIDEQDRIRPHIKLFVNGEQARRLDVPARGDVHILAALSGG